MCSVALCVACLFSCRARSCPSPTKIFGIKNALCSCLSFQLSCPEFYTKMVGGQFCSKLRVGTFLWHEIQNRSGSICGGCIKIIEHRLVNYWLVCEWSGSHKTYIWNEYAWFVTNNTKPRETKHMEDSLVTKEKSIIPFEYRFQIYGFDTHWIFKGSNIPFGKPHNNRIQKEIVVCDNQAKRVGPCKMIIVFGYYSVSNIISNLRIEIEEMFWAICMRIRLFECIIEYSGFSVVNCSRLHAFMIRLRHILRRFCFLSICTHGML